MRAEIIAVGTELLLGDILNTNAQYLSKRLADMGIDVYYQTVVGDNAERVKNAYKLAFERADLVITTGGLGPTKDDLTKEAAAEYFGRKLVLDEASLESIKDYFEAVHRPMSENNVKQAMLPEGCTILKNDNGTAPGCIVDDGKRIIVLLPGPPKEMKPMFEVSVVPYLEKNLKSVLVSKVLRLTGIGEGSMAEEIADIIESSVNPTVAPYAKETDVILRITAKAENREKAQALILPVEEKIRQRLGKFIYAEGDESIEDVVASKLIENKLTIATAESCTGGLLAGTLINYPGISSVFLEGAVTYSNEAKMKRLKVKEETLRKFGAVSSETAAEMAEGIAREAGTDIGVSTTGIAGPGGGTPEKPVGLVYVGLYIRGKVMTKELHLKGDRQTVRNRAVMEVLNWVRKEL